MPGSTLPNTGVVQPLVGGDSGVWGTGVNAALANYDAHDHGPGKGARINTDGIAIDADLTFSSLYAPINLHRLTFASIVALSSSNKSLFVSSSDNELYWRSNAGANVKLTSGSALNVAAFVGGIGGDYSSVSALVDYDDATDTYRFRQEINTAVRQFAKVRFADIQLVEYDAAGDASVPAFAVTIKSPDALAGNYSVTMPAALPGSTSLVQMDSAGALTASNTVANTVTLSSTLAAAAISASGLIFGENGITSAVNTHITVSGTGEYKHGDRILNIPGAAVGPSTGVSLTSIGSAQSAGAATFVVPLPLHVGDRIKSVTFERFGDGAVDLTVDVGLRTAGVAGSLSIGSNNVTNAAAAWTDTTVNCTDTVITELLTVSLVVVSNAALAGLDTIRVTYDHP